MTDKHRVGSADKWGSMMFCFVSVCVWEASGRPSPCHLILSYRHGSCNEDWLLMLGRQSINRHTAFSPPPPPSTSFVVSHSPSPDKFVLFGEEEEKYSKVKMAPFRIHLFPLKKAQKIDMGGENDDGWHTSWEGGMIYECGTFSAGGPRPNPDGQGWEAITLVLFWKIGMCHWSVRHTTYTQNGRCRCRFCVFRVSKRVENGIAVLGIRKYPLRSIMNRTHDR